MHTEREREREKECIAGLNQVAFKNLVEVSATEYFSFFFFFLKRRAPSILKDLVGHPFFTVTCFAQSVS